MKSLTTTNTGNAVTIPQFYAGNAEPNQPARLQTVPAFTQLNPNWYRALQISDEYVFIRHGQNAVVISLNDLVNMALVREPNLTWSPPVVLADPISVAGNVSDELNVSANIGSEIGISYQWLMSADGTNWSNAANVANTLTVEDTNTALMTFDILSNAADGYQFKLQATDNGLSFGLDSNGSVNTAAATLTVRN